MANPERYLVCGPPGCGKTTWVTARRQPGDCVFDMDALADALFGLPKYPRPNDVTECLLMLRETLMMRTKAANRRRLFLIMTDSVEALRWSRRINGVVIDLTPVLQEVRING